MQAPDGRRLTATTPSRELMTWRLPVRGRMVTGSTGTVATESATAAVRSGTSPETAQRLGRWAVAAIVPATIAGKPVTYLGTAPRSCWAAAVGAEAIVLATTVARPATSLGTARRRAPVAAAGATALAITVARPATFLGTAQRKAVAVAVAVAATTVEALVVATRCTRFCQRSSLPHDDPSVCRVALPSAALKTSVRMRTVLLFATAP